MDNGERGAASYKWGTYAVGSDVHFLGPVDKFWIMYPCVALWRFYGNLELPVHQYLQNVWTKCRPDKWSIIHCKCTVFRAYEENYDTKFAHGRRDDLNFLHVRWSLVSPKFWVTQSVHIVVLFQRFTDSPISSMAKLTCIKLRDESYLMKTRLPKIICINTCFDFSHQVTRRLPASYACACSYCIMLCTWRFGWSAEV